jgi:hypothetical protein
MVSMITYDRPLTQRIPLDRPWHEAMLCRAHWHNWARWERLTATLTEKHGRTTSEREVFVQVREAICCGISQMKHL